MRGKAVDIRRGDDRQPGRAGAESRALSFPGDEGGHSLAPQPQCCPPGL